MSLIHSLKAIFEKNIRNLNFWIFQFLQIRISQRHSCAQVVLGLLIWQFPKTFITPNSFTFESITIDWNLTPKTNRKLLIVSTLIEIIIDILLYTQITRQVHNHKANVTKTGRQQAELMLTCQREFVYSGTKLTDRWMVVIQGLT